MAKQGHQGFIWLPREDPTTWQLLVNSVDLTEEIFGAEFTLPLCPDIAMAKIEVVNADGSFSDAFDQTQLVEAYIDLGSSATTKRFKGKIDSINNKRTDDKGYVLEITASQAFLFDIVVTESYDGTKTCDTIFKELVAVYYPAYTTTNVEPTTSTLAVVWDNKPFWDCIADLCKQAGFDAFLDADDDFNFFLKNSRENNNEAIIYDDTLIEANGLINQSYTIKNKITVYGDDGAGLPVIFSSGDDASQASYGVKEQVIFDNKIQDADSASDKVTSELGDQSENDLEGDTRSLILPSLKPGEKIWISDPTLKVHGQFRIYSLTHKFHDYQTISYVNQERKQKNVMKKRVDNELSSQTAINPYKLTRSWNIPFNSSSELSAAESNILVSNGIVSLSSGTQGVFSCSIIADFAVAQVQLKVVGNNVTKNLYELSIDGGAYLTLTPEDLFVISTAGTSLVLRVTMVGAGTEIDSMALLYA